MFKFLKTYWKTILMAAIVFLLSVFDFSKVDNLPKMKYNDKIIHLFLYSFLTFLLIFESWNEVLKKSKNYMYIFYLLTIPIIFGGIIELVQEFYFPPRTAEWFDWIADILGVALGGLISIFYLKRKK